jgi:LemA protein
MSIELVLIVVVILLVGVMWLYNTLVQGRLRVREAWSAIQVQLQRRVSLIPNLVETVKGYASHERETLESLTRARSQLQSATTPGDAAQANNMMTQALKSLFAVAEAYPDLKANQNFLDLQAQLADTEDKIAYARNYYNSRVLSYNTTIHTIPGIFVAGPLGFAPEEFFGASGAAQNEVQVTFS